MSYIDPNSGRAPQPGGVGAPQVARNPEPEVATAEASIVEDDDGEQEQEQEEQEDSGTSEDDAESDDDGDDDGDGDGDGGEGGDTLEDHTHAELKDIAGELEIEGRHQMNKASLIEAINEAREA